MTLQSPPPSAFDSEAGRVRAKTAVEIVRCDATPCKRRQEWFSLALDSEELCCRIHFVMHTDWRFVLIAESDVSSAVWIEPREKRAQLSKICFDTSEGRGEIAPQEC